MGRLQRRKKPSRIEKKMERLISNFRMTDKMCHQKKWAHTPPLGHVFRLEKRLERATCLELLPYCDG